MSDYTRIIADYVARTTYDDLSDEAIISAKKSILDTLGAMFPATTLAETCDIVHDLYLELDQGGDCSLIGYGEKASLLSAVMINGSLTHAADFDDTAGIDKPTVHPTANCFPAALGLAEHLGGISGKQFITAIALADDVGIRIASCVKGNLLWDYDFFSQTTIGVFQATVAASKILDLNSDQVLDALGLAVNRVAGMYEGLMFCEFRSIRDAFGNEEGVRCALLASRGLKGCENGIELLHKVIYHDNVDPYHLTEKLGEDFYNAKYIGYKPWPSCGGTHPYIQACLETMAENHIPPEDIEKVILIGCEKSTESFYPKEEKSQPKTSITAKTALPYVVAVAIRNQNVVLADFEIKNLANTEIYEITKIIEFAVDETFGPNSATAKITTKDGKEYEGHVDILRGNVLNPMSLEELIGKFKSNATLAKHHLPEKIIDSLVDRLLSLEDVADVKEVTSLLA